MLTWVLKEHQGLEMINKAALVQFLQQEYQEVSGGGVRGASEENPGDAKPGPWLTPVCSFMQSAVLGRAGWSHTGAQPVPRTR